MLPERLPFDDLRDCMGPEHKLEFLYEACVALYSLALDLIVTYKDLSGKQQVNLRAVDEMRSNLQGEDEPIAVELRTLLTFAVPIRGHEAI